MEYRRLIAAEYFLYCINITHTDCCDYSTFLTKKVKFILQNCVGMSFIFVFSMVLVALTKKEKLW